MKFALRSEDHLSQSVHLRQFAHFFAWIAVLLLILTFFRIGEMIVNLMFIAILIILVCKSYYSARSIEKIVQETVTFSENAAIIQDHRGKIIKNIPYQAITAIQVSPLGGRVYYICVFSNNMQLSQWKYFSDLYNDNECFAMEYQEEAWRILQEKMAAYPNCQNLGWLAVGRKIDK